ncbi:Na+/H+ antiporter [Flavobacterium sp. NKUCC04_CG]|uniref:Na+/H+ antiporter n=1 Tax=Flavobacterium sp. NKUCC04_CG TaxID=2842121 RepID=UPI001C5BC7DF|nr:Na+/H+ antiporter [Flavobacterium sp. NKUCC04_CG]MBW3519241.1 Na+/H+ antiporter [Flavobacterium sp. NKUCC04_CG]
MAELEKIIWISTILIILISLKDKIKLALPILLVLAGLLLSFTALVPSIEMSPELIFYVVLPPILFDAAWNTSIPEFKKEFPKISILAVVLVFLTTTIVAVVVHSLIPGFGWPMAFVLGAIVSPPDAVAATSITKSIALPKKMITILEGESLLNDASALIAYKFAVVAVLSGGFSFWNAGFQFVFISLGGIVAGIVIGFLFLRIYRFFNGNSNVETFAVVLLPFATYSLAEHLGCSGVLAVVVVGMYLSWNSFVVFTTNSRMQMGYFWDVIIFVINGLVFLVLGMQLPKIISDTPQNELPLLIFYGFLIFIILVLVRMCVLFAFPLLGGALKNKSQSGLSQSSKEYLIISWAGMRGVVSLATGLALPLTTSEMVPLAHRNTVLLLSFVVIVFTLLIQGLTLPKLIQWIKPTKDFHREEGALNILLLYKSISFLKEFSADDLETQQAVMTMLDKLQAKNHNLLTESESVKGINSKKAYLNLELQLVEWQRTALTQSYKSGTFSLETIRKKEIELDFWKTTIEHESGQSY